MAKKDAAAGEAYTTPKEAVRLLKVSRRKVLDLCRNGQLPAVKIGREWRLTPGWREELLASSSS